MKYLWNQFLGDYNYFHRKTKVSNRPEVFIIELTNYCNLRCTMCPRRFMKRHVGFMDFELFKNIIDQVKDYNDYVWLAEFGESLFHPKFETFIKYCANNGVKTYLSTNATALNEKNSLEILNSGLDKIYLCLDGTTKETYEKLRINGQFEKTKNNIFNFLKLKKKLHRSKPYSVVQIIKMDETEKEIEDFKKQWDGLADEVWAREFCTWADQIKDIKKMSREENKYFPFRKKRYPCSLLWRKIVVSWNGDVVPCCLDFDGKIVLGNAKRENLEDIWNSKKMVELRKKQIDGDYNNPLCKKCIEWPGDEKDAFYPFSMKLFKKAKRILVR